ncbi:MAG TPA: exopolysaccharide transport family protein [Rhizomicrobium sp.]|nr:exopolysaccharide transport family protein [Rhizomicrobium sp.]
MSAYRPTHDFLPGVPAVSRGRGAPNPPQGFHLADFIRMVHARRRLILRVAAGTVACALIAALLLPTSYSSNAVVMLDPRKNNVTDISAVLSQLSADPASLQNQIQILQSRELAATVIARLKLSADPEFNAALPQPGLAGQAALLLDPRQWFARRPRAGATDNDRIIDAFLRHVDAQAQGLSTAITITAKSRDASRAALIANTLADAYVKAQVTDKMTAAAATTSWLNNRLKELAQQLQAQEEEIQRYKAENGLNDSAPGNSLVDQQMAAINAQIVQARSDLAEKEAVSARLKQLARRGNSADAGQIAASPLIVQLRSQQAQVVAEEGNLASKYGALHPKMQALEQQKRELDAKIAQEVGRLAAGADNDVMVARAHVASLEASLGGTEHTATTQNMARIRLQALESNAASTRTMYEAFVQRLRQSQNMDEVQTPESRIISRAPVPLYPSAPRRTLIVGAALPLGLLLGVLMALLMEKLGPLMPVRAGAAPGVVLEPPARTSPAPARKGPPILGEINDAAALPAADFVPDYPASRYARAMAALVRQLESRAGSGGAVVALTSADAGENRSVIAVSLARAAARMGKKTVMLDCAQGTPATRALNAPVAAGLHEVLGGEIALNKALAKDPRCGVWLLGTMKRPASNAEVYASPAMVRLVSVLRGGADFVVIDCGPATAGPEAALIARLADATVLVCRRQALDSAMMGDAQRILESAQAAPVGIVVTK